MQLTWPNGWHELIVELHGRARPTVLAVTGGGASAIAELLAVPGASRTVLEACVPYAAHALIDWLGRRPDQFCDERTALAMASVGCDRARKLIAAQGESLNEPFGVGCTASLASDRPKRGDHRCFIAVQSPRTTASYSLILEKDTRSRAEEEAIVGQLIIRTLAEAAGLTDLPKLSLYTTEKVDYDAIVADPILSAVWNGQTDCVWSLIDGSLAAAPPIKPVGILCGAFDPLHRAHAELRNLAEKLLGGPVNYELSITNVDKPPLDFLSIDRRCKQFVAKHPVALTNAPRFFRKAEIFPGTTFVVGSDTAERIIHPKYYNGDQAALESALATIRKHGCRFLVATRVVDGKPLSVADLPIPKSAADMFTAIPEEQFRIDLSSTELRQQASVGREPSDS
jgi:nicotinamide mononucleotide (NMN) deamidase PncC